MSERLYASFVKKNAALAEPTYRHIWSSLRKNGARMAERQDPKDRLNLPLSETTPNTKLEIPSRAIWRVADLPDQQAWEVLELTRQTDKTGENLLSRRQVVSSIHELRDDYRRVWEPISTFFSMERGHTMRTTAGLVLMYFLYKGTQMDADLSPLLQGRLVDLMAVPFAATCFRGAYMHLRPTYIWENIDRVSTLPPVQMVREASSLRGIPFTYISTGLGLVGAYAAEALQDIAPHFGFSTGVFDPGDLVAYAVGATAYVGFQKLREKIVTSRIVDSLTRKKK